MVAQSTTQVVHNSPTTVPSTTNPKPLELPSVEINLENCEIDPEANKFWEAVAPKTAEDENATGFSVTASFWGPHLPTERVLVLPNQATAFFDVCRPVTNDNKELLTKLMDKADDAGCTKIIGCIENDGTVHMKEVIRSFLSCGFSFIPPAVVGFEGYIFVGQEF
jgi:hypothetical protein